MKPKYLRMIKNMKEPSGGEPAAGEGDAAWSVYVLRCGDGSLYTGIAKDAEARVKKHADGKGAAYTRTHLPVEMVYKESDMTRSQALIREAKIKAMPRPRKDKLIMGIENEK